MNPFSEIVVLGKAVEETKGNHHSPFTDPAPSCTTTRSAPISPTGC